MAEASPSSAPSPSAVHAAYDSAGISADEKLWQVHRILNSKTFLNSRQLRRFLEFVVKASLDGCEDDIKEYTIGTRVFGRGVDFDPRQDTLVRTQAGRLRLRLETFYRTEGAADEILLDLPKGHYVPRFERRTPSFENPVESGKEDAVLAIDTPAFAAPRLPAVPSSDLIDLHFRLPRKVAMALGGVLLVSMAAAGAWRAHSKSLPAPAPPSLAAEFWSSFVDREMPPVVSFGDHSYLMSETSDLLRYSGDETYPKGTLMTPSNLPVRDQKVSKYLGPLYFNDDFTGTGEVYAVARMARLFTQIGTQLTVTRSQLLSSAYLNQRNVIMIGHSAANGILLHSQERSAMPFAWDRGGTAPWRGRIVNSHPQVGEEALYQVERDPVSRALHADYALATFTPGIAQGRKLAILGGVTTLGTRGAAEFLASDDGIAQVASHLGAPRKDGRALPPPFFQAVLRVEIAKGDILRVQYVTGRALDR